MSIEISEETETRLAAEAQRQGISVNALLERLIDERVAPTRLAPASAELPVWHLGGAARLHRRDINDDER